MKKQLSMTSAMAATLLAAGGCSSNDGWNEGAVAQRDTAVCVDSAGTRVDDDMCDDDRYRGGGGGSSAFLWYYMGRNSALPYYGDSIHNRRFAGGSYRAAPGTAYARAPVSTRITRSQAVSRGGFGSSSRRFGGSRS